MSWQCPECGEMNAADMNTCECGHGIEVHREKRQRKKVLETDINEDAAPAASSEAVNMNDGRFNFPNIGGKVVGVLLFSLVLVGGWKFLGIKPQDAEFPGVAFFYLLFFLIEAVGLLGVAFPLYKIGGIEVTEEDISEFVLLNLWRRSMRWADVAGMERSGNLLRDSVFTLQSKQGDYLVISAMDAGAAHARQLSTLMLSYAARFGIPVTGATLNADEVAIETVPTLPSDPLSAAKKHKAGGGKTVNYQVHEPARGTPGTGTFTQKEKKEPLSLAGIVVPVVLLFIGAEMMVFAFTSFGDTQAGTAFGLLAFLGFCLVLAAGYSLISKLIGSFTGERSVTIEVGKEFVTYGRRGLINKDWRIAYADIADIGYRTTMRYQRRNHSGVTSGNRSEIRESTYEEVMARYTGGFTPRSLILVDSPYGVPDYEYSCLLTASDESEYSISSGDVSWENFTNILSLIEGNVRAARGDDRAPAEAVAPVKKTAPPVLNMESPDAEVERHKSCNANAPEAVDGAVHAPGQAHEPPKGNVGTGAFTSRFSTKQRFPSYGFGLIGCIIAIIVGIKLMKYASWNEYSITGGIGFWLISVPVIGLYILFKGLFAEDETMVVSINKDGVTYQKRGNKPVDWHVAYADITRIVYLWSESEDGTYEQVIARTDGRFDRPDDKSSGEDADAGPPDDPDDEFRCCITAKNSNEYEISSDEFAWKDYLQIIALIEGNARAVREGKEIPGDAPTP